MPNILITNLTTMMPPVNKGQYTANREVHLETLSANEFEEFTYWLYKTEIADGTWNGMYDTIHLIQASSDMARDCALYKNNKLAGVIQCKHSTNPTNALSESVFAKEIIKFGLYAIVFKTELPISQDLPYYIVTNTGFKEDCEKLIDDFRNQIDTYANLEKYSNSAISTYKSLKGLNFKTIENELRDNLKKLSLKKVDHHELKKTLLKPYQEATILNYFHAMPVVSKALIAPIEAKLDDVLQKVQVMVSPPPPERPSQIIFEGTYIPRYVHAVENDFFAYMLGQKDTLEDELLKNRHLALIGWGQTGKSTALRHLAATLSDGDHEDHVFFIHLDDYTDKDIKDLIPRINERPVDKLLVILDGLDEVLQQHYSTAVAKIKAFVREYPLVRMVVSCRENFYAIHADRSELNTLPHFLSLRLQDLDEETIDDHLNSYENFDLSNFVNRIKEEELQDLVKIPFYLIRFASEFHQTGKLIKGKSALFNELFDKSAIEAAKKQPGKDISAKVPIIKSALERLAFVMEVQGKNFFTRDDLVKILDGPAAEFVQEAGTIIYGSADAEGHWRFIHHHMQEYLAAKVLARQTPDLVMGIITRDPAHTILRPSWAHTISFLIGILEQGDHLRQEIIDLLINNEPGLLMQFEPENISKEVRHAIFKKLMDSAGLQDKRLHRSKFEPIKLARFSQTEDNIRYAIDLLNSPKSDVQLSNILEVVAFYRLETFPTLKPALRRAVEQHLTHDDEFTRYLAIRALIQLFRLKDNEYQLLFDQFQSSSNSYIRYILFHSIWQQGYTEKFLGYALSQIRLIMSEEKRESGHSTTHSSRLGNEAYELLNVIRSVATEAGVIEMVKHWSNNLGLYSYTISFREYRTQLFKLAKKLQSVSIFGQVTATILTNIRTFAGGHSFSEIAVYLQSTGRASELVRSIYQSAAPAGWEHFILISQLMDQQGFEFLEQEAINKKMTEGQAQMFQRQIPEKAPDWEAKWNDVVTTNFQIPPPVIIDHKAEHQQETVRKAKALFDRAVFKHEVQSLFTAVSKDPIKYDDLHVLDPKDRINYHVFYWVFKNLERKFDFLGEYNLAGVLSDIDTIPEIPWMSKIYIFLKEQRDVNLDQDQIQILKEWVDVQIDKLNFKNSYGFMSDEGGVEPELDPMIITSFLLRRFEFKGYAKEKYLDLLSTHRYNDQETDIFEFVLSATKLSDVTERVYENLAEGGLKYQVLQNHIDHLLAHDLKDGADLLIPYLANKETYEWPNVLSAFRKLGGDMKKLQGLLDKLDGYVQTTLINALKETIPNDTRQWLSAMVKTPMDQDQKLRYAKQLIWLQDRDGLQIYYDHIRSEGRIPDSSAPGNPLYVVHQLSLMDLALEIYQFAYEGSYIYDIMSDLKSIATHMLSSLAFSGNNFQSFKSAFETFLDDKAAEVAPEPEKRQELLYQAKYWFEGAEHQYYLRDEKPIGSDEAIAMAKKLKTD
ncbi:hypothetical protein DJ568_03020 [Mucilaginibacter hurinus]|uniref:NACHT domain-containing protein n=1 Tax=Mucilaginibacter hurinus TaxID=2201324 RepID=A0A367GTV6_9SPHI|nr:hypothetical protein [Mucilaginibacter hurinus]RCH56842.1 hypothetical protein DJ568_03020 [Mucilaginibacter hurinus]